MRLTAARRQLRARPLDHQQPDQERGPAYDHADHEDPLEHAVLLLVTGCSPNDLPDSINPHRDAEPDLEGVQVSNLQREGQSTLRLDTCAPLIQNLVSEA